MFFSETLRHEQTELDIELYCLAKDGIGMFKEVQDIIANLNDSDGRRYLYSEADDPKKEGAANWFTKLFSKIRSVIIIILEHVVKVINFLLGIINAIFGLRLGIAFGNVKPRNTKEEKATTKTEKVANATEVSKDQFDIINTKISNYITPLGKNNPISHIPNPKAFLLRLIQSSMGGELVKYVEEKVEQSKTVEDLNKEKVKAAIRKKAKHITAEEQVKGSTNGGSNEYYSGVITEETLLRDFYNLAEGSRDSLLNKIDQIVTDVAKIFRSKDAIETAANQEQEISDVFSSYNLKELGFDGGIFNIVSELMKEEFNPLNSKTGMDKGYLNLIGERLLQDVHSFKIVQDIPVSVYTGKEDLIEFMRAYIAVIQNLITISTNASAPIDKAKISSLLAATGKLERQYEKKFDITKYNLNKEGLNYKDIKDLINGVQTYFESIIPDEDKFQFTGGDNNTYKLSKVDLMKSLDITLKMIDFNFETFIRKPELFGNPKTIKEEIYKQRSALSDAMVEAKKGIEGLIKELKYTKDEKGEYTDKEKNYDTDEMKKFIANDYDRKDFVSSLKSSLNLIQKIFTRTINEYTDLIHLYTAIEVTEVTKNILLIGMKMSYILYVENISYSYIRAVGDTTENKDLLAKIKEYVIDREKMYTKIKSKMI